MYMPRQGSHDRNNKRQFSGERYAQQVVDFFNFVSLSTEEGLVAKAKARVLDVIEATRALSRARKEDPQWFKNRNSALQANGFIFANPSEAVSRAMTTINNKLARYPTFPAFLPDPRTTTLMTIGQAQLGKPTALRGMELFAVHAVVHLEAAGLLDQMRTCTCGKWYFARFSHQRFCSVGCRERFWEASEERKTQKREKARENYLYRKAHPKLVRRRK
jgi:hypothetical protein